MRSVLIKFHAQQCWDGFHVKRTGQLVVTSDAPNRMDNMNQISNRIKGLSIHLHCILQSVA